MRTPCGLCNSGRAVLTSRSSPVFTEKDQALVLDLQSDLRSQASPMENKGVPWVWNMLHNFGGRMGMDGVPEVLAGAIPEAYNNSKYMKGIGITPEAIDNSPIVYELLFDMTWEQDPIDHRAWTREYVKRRYGGTDTKIEQAWDILLETAYKYNPGTYYQGASGPSSMRVPMTRRSAPHRRGVIATSATTRRSSSARPSCSRRATTPIRIARRSVTTLWT